MKTEEEVFAQLVALIVHRFPTGCSRACVPIVTSGQRVASALSPISASVRDDRLPFGARFATFVQRHRSPYLSTGWQMKLSGWHSMTMIGGRAVFVGRR